MASNYDVLQSWMYGYAASTHNLKTKEGQLYSYGHRIGTTIAGKRYIWRVNVKTRSGHQAGAMRSHVSQARVYAGRPIEIPEPQNDDDIRSAIKNLDERVVVSSEIDALLSQAC